MRRAHFGGALVAGLVAIGLAHAQQPMVPGAPPLPGGPTPPTTGAAATPAPAAPAAAPPRNIFSFFTRTPEQKAQCKAHFCNSRVGMFVNNLLVPAGLATGGFLGPICPPPGAPGGPGGPGGPPNPDDLKKSPTSPEGAAAKIKQDEMQAKAKIAALEFLGTVDCRYYPEAEAGLIAGLRAEKNECVRLAAAKALASGCCCSPKVIKALMTTVNCSNKDGFPAEASELVRTYAYVALERCLRKVVEEEPELPPEPPPAAKQAMYESLAPIGQTLDYSAHIILANYYPMSPTETPAQIIADARLTLSRGLHLSPHTIARLSGPKNVRDALFPGDSRPGLSLASFNMPAFASMRMPSFSRPTTNQEPPSAVQPNQRPPVMPTAMNSPPTRLTPVPAPMQRVNTAAGPTVVPVPAPTPRTGRGNLLHIFQDAFKR
ncbi:MAG: hypothetical protein L0241_26490 [Planctomycetia bacterium]|nr:hypothetical protein [Planctomycetia bacterium]